MRRLIRSLSAWPISWIVGTTIFAVATTAVLVVAVLGYYQSRHEVAAAQVAACRSMVNILALDLRPHDTHRAVDDPEAAQRLLERLDAAREAMASMRVARIEILALRDEKCFALVSSGRNAETVGDSIELTPAMRMAFGGSANYDSAKLTDDDVTAVYQPLWPRNSLPNILAFHFSSRAAPGSLMMDRRVQGALSIIAILLITVLVSVSVSRALTSPVHSFVDATRSLAAGNFDARAPEVGHNELGDMAHAFNQMAGTLGKRSSEIRDAQRVSILALATLAEKRDRETGAHLYRTRAYCNALAAHLAGYTVYSSAIDSDFLLNLDLIAPLHDIGKVATPDRVLLKPGRLDPEEITQMRQHVCEGADTLSEANEQLEIPSPLLTLAENIARYHHERWDGSGYLEGLAGEAIPLEARIFAVADVYDAVRTERVYKLALSHDEAAEIVLGGSGTQFDPVVVDAFKAVEARFIELGDRKWDEQVARFPITRLGRMAPREAPITQFDDGSQTRGLM